MFGMFLMIPIAKFLETVNRSVRSVVWLGKYFECEFLGKCIKSNSHYVKVKKKQPYITF